MLCVHLSLTSHAKAKQESVLEAGVPSRGHTGHSCPCDDCMLAGESAKPRKGSEKAGFSVRQKDKAPE